MATQPKIPFDLPCNAVIAGTGSFVPDSVLTNEDFTRRMDTSDEWITTRTGIKSRHVCSETDTTATLATEAARRALADAQLTAEQIDLILGRLFQTRPDLPPPQEYFDAIVSGDDITRNKPAPDIYLLAAERLSVAPAECLVFEDTPPGVKAAVTAGMAAVAVPNQYTKSLEFPGARGAIGSLCEASPYLDL